MSDSKQSYPSTRNDSSLVGLSRKTYSLRIMTVGIVSSLSVHDALAQRTIAAIANSERKRPSKDI